MMLRRYADEAGGRKGDTGWTEPPNTVGERDTCNALHNFGEGAKQEQNKGPTHYCKTLMRCALCTVQYCTAQRHEIVEFSTPPTAFFLLVQ